MLIYKYQCIRYTLLIYHPVTNILSLIGLHIGLCVRRWCGLVLLKLNFPLIPLEIGILCNRLYPKIAFDKTLIITVTIRTWSEQKQSIVSAWIYGWNNHDNKWILHDAGGQLEGRV